MALRMLLKTEVVIVSDGRVCFHGLRLSAVLAKDIVMVTVKMCALMYIVYALYPSFHSLSLCAVQAGVCTCGYESMRAHFKDVCDRLLLLIPKTKLESEDREAVFILKKTVSFLLLSWKLPIVNPIYHIWHQSSVTTDIFWP